MMIEIAVTENSAGRFYNLTTEKAAMSVSVTRYFVTVCVQNASARAWGRGAGGMGKTFHGADALTKAAASYKSSACKAMVEAVQEAERAIVGAVAATACA